MFCVTVLSLLLVSSVLGDYEVEVTIHSYQNPTGRCDGCRQPQFSNPGCCDEVQIRPAGQSCPTDDTCDISVDYCIRSLRSTAESCPVGEAVLSPFAVEETNTYSMSPSFFGINNPLLIIGRNESWTGLQLFFEIQDAVLVNNGFSEVVLIDRIAIDIDTPVGVSSEAIIYKGNANIAQVNASFEVRCADNFTGYDCSTPCPNSQSCDECGLPDFSGLFCHISSDCSVCNGSNVRCVHSMTGTFFCTCEIGFTGEDCETEIDYCIGVNCSDNGDCQNSMGSYYCLCDNGYTGILCEVEVDECEFVTCSGHGQCVDGVGSFICECEEGFAGTLCESKNQVSPIIEEQGNEEEGNITLVTDSRSSTVVYIIGGSVAALLLLVIICTLLFIALSMIIKSRKSAEILRSEDSLAIHTEHPVLSNQIKSDD